MSTMSMSGSSTAANRTVGLVTKTQTGTHPTGFTAGATTLFNWTGDVQILAIWGVVSTDIEAAATTCKLSFTCDALAAVDMCATKDINHFHAGSRLSITGTLTDAMIGTDVVGGGVSQASAIDLTSITSGIITCTMGAASDGAIVWKVLWIPLTTNATITAA